MNIILITSVVLVLLFHKLKKYFYLKEKNTKSYAANLKINYYVKFINLHGHYGIFML